LPETKIFNTEEQRKQRKLKGAGYSAATGVPD
jgi:hypothetical protein